MKSVFNKVKAFFLCATLLVLSACASPLTDQEISGLSNEQLCTVSRSNPDPRLDAEIKRKGLDCDPATLNCKAQGLKKNTKEFSSCVVIQRRKSSDPAFSYCLDSGFQMGTELMLVCMVAHQERQERQEQQAHKRSQDMIESGLKMIEADRGQYNSDSSTPILNQQTHCTSRYSPGNRTVNTDCW